MVLRVGCSGWSYAAWEGIFYPRDLSNKLSHYANIFSTAEIDSTFYSYPEERVVHGWVRHTPEGFIFAAKLPKQITHEKRLNIKKGVEADLARFLSLIEPLRASGKLGPLLIQLPPGFRRNQSRLEDFLNLLPKSHLWAVEFRHMSWWNEGTWQLLRKYDVANTVVDEPLLPPEPVVTSSFSFVRFHGRGTSTWYNYLYSIDELKAWLPKLKMIKEKVNDTYLYMNNHHQGFAVLNTLQLLQLTGEITATQEQVLNRVKEALKPRAVKGLPYLSEEKKNLLDELKELTTELRWQRGLEIPSSEVVVDEVTAGGARGWVRGYFIEISLRNKVIRHECPDWQKTAEIDQLRLCKHLIAFVRDLGDHDAMQIIHRLCEERDTWAMEARSSF